MVVKHWDVYLAGNEFVIRSDHDPLVQLRKINDPRGKFSRWITQLEEYKYWVEYVPGKFNVKADALYRNGHDKEILLPNDFDERIYTISCKQDENFKNQFRKEQFEDPIIHSAFKDEENENEILTDRLERVGNQLRIENGILTKGIFYWPNMYKYIPIV